MIKIRQKQYKRLKFQVLLLQFHGTMTKTFLRNLKKQETQFICLCSHVFTMFVNAFYHNILHLIIFKHNLPKTQRTQRNLLNFLTRGSTHSIFSLLKSNKSSSESSYCIKCFFDSSS